MQFPLSLSLSLSEFSSF
jgi:hypothetical protein